MRRSVIVAAVSMTFVAALAPPAFAAWSSEVAFGNNAPIQPVGLVVPSKGRPALAWQNGGSLYAATYALTTGWSRELVRNEPDHASCRTQESEFLGPAITLTAKGEPRIASVCDAVGGPSPVRLSKPGADPGTWKTTVVGTGPFRDGVGALTATSVDVAIDPAGRPTIVIASRGTDEISRFLFDGQTWRRKRLAVEAFPASIAVSIDVDPVTGYLGVAWTQATSGGAVRYARFDGRTVVGSIETIPIGSDLAFGIPSLAHLDDGTAVVAFQRGTSAGRWLSVAVENGGGWDLHDVADGAQVSGGNPSVAIGASGWRVAYHDETNGDLRLATSLDGQSWTSELLDAAGDIGEYPSLGLTASGAVRIASYDRDGTAIRWTKQV